MQTQIERDDLRVATAGGCRQRGAKLRDRLWIAGAIGADQILGLLLEMVEICPVGQSVHRTTSVHIADGPQYRLHKGSHRLDLLQVGSTLPAGPGTACNRDLRLGPVPGWVKTARR